MACRRCSSPKQGTFRTEMNIHFPGWEGLSKPTVMAFPEVTICLNCGFAEFNVTDRELAALTEGLSDARAQSA